MRIFSKYGSKYKPYPKVTLSLANHLYASRDRTEQHADHSDNYFLLLVEFMNEISANPNVINAPARLAESIKWLEDRVTQKEANDVLLKVLVRTFEFFSVQKFRNFQKYFPLSYLDFQKYFPLWYILKAIAWIYKKNISTRSFFFSFTKWS